MDQMTFHAKIITDTSLIFRPGTTVMITSNLAPSPYVPDGLYSVKDNNTVQITIRNTDVCPIKLLKGKPITGITVHLLDEEYYEEIPISKDTLRTYFLANEVLTNEHNTPQQGTKPEAKEYTPKQHLDHIAKNLRHASSLLEESGLDPPGIREKPLQDPSPEVTKNLLEQFDTKDVEQEWIPAYQQIILDLSLIHISEPTRPY